MDIHSAERKFVDRFRVMMPSIARVSGLLELTDRYLSDGPMQYAEIFALGVMKRRARHHSSDQEYGAWHSLGLVFYIFERNNEAIEEFGKALTAANATWEEIESGALYVTAVIAGYVGPARAFWSNPGDTIEKLERLLSRIGRYESFRRTAIGSAAFNDGAALVQLLASSAERAVISKDPGS